MIDIINFLFAEGCMAGVMLLDGKSNSGGLHCI